MVHTRPPARRTPSGHWCDAQDGRVSLRTRAMMSGHRVCCAGLSNVQSHGTLRGRSHHRSMRFSQVPYGRSNPNAICPARRAEPCLLMSLPAGRTQSQVHLRPVGDATLAHGCLCMRCARSPAPCMHEPRHTLRGARSGAHRAHRHGLRPCAEHVWQRGADRRARRARQLARRTPRRYARRCGVRAFRVSCVPSERDRVPGVLSPRTVVAILLLVSCVPCKECVLAYRSAHMQSCRAVRARLKAAPRRLNSVLFIK